MEKPGTPSVEKKESAAKSRKQKKKKVSNTSPDKSQPAIAPRREEEPASTSLENKESTIESDKKVGPASTSREKKESTIESDAEAGPASTSQKKKESTIESDAEAGPASTSREKESTIESDKKVGPASTSRVKEESDIIKKPASMSPEKESASVSDVIAEPASTSREKKKSTIESDKKVGPASTSRVKDESDIITKPASTSPGKESTGVYDVIAEPASTSRMKENSASASEVELRPSAPNLLKIADQVVNSEKPFPKKVEKWLNDFSVYWIYRDNHGRDAAYKALKTRYSEEQIAEQLAWLRDVEDEHVKAEIAWMYNRLAKECASHPDVLAFKWKAMQLHPEEVAEMLAIKHTKSLSSLEHSADEWLYYTKLLEGENSELALPIKEVWPLLFGKMESQEIKHFFRSVKDPDGQGLVAQMTLNQESLHKSK